MNPTVVAVAGKSPVLAFILIFLFGPFGFLYVSILGGVVLLALYGLLFGITVGLAGPLLALANIPLALVGAWMVARWNRAELARVSAQVSSGR